MRLHKNGVPISCVADWKRTAPPKADYQWVEGRSAYELAYAWCGGGAPAVPEELTALFESRAETRGLIVDEVLPEHRVSFDAHGGEPRNADLALVGHAPESKIAVTIEAKADESFGATVAQTLTDALERSIENPRSHGVRRIEDLVRALLPARSKGLPHVRDLRYQLLTATAGTLAYAAAEHASLAVFIVHEFITDQTVDRRHAANAADYEMFLHRLTGSSSFRDLKDPLLGPFTMPDSSPFRGIPLLIGKIASNRRTPNHG
jgi:hypothetical protein